MVELRLKILSLMAAALITVLIGTHRSEMHHLISYAEKVSGKILPSNFILSSPINGFIGRPSDKTAAAAAELFVPYAAPVVEALKRIGGPAGVLVGPIWAAFWRSAVADMWGAAAYEEAVVSGSDKKGGDFPRRM